MKQAAMVCVGAVLLAATGVAHKMTQAEAAPTYAFRLPAMFHQCLLFPPPKDGDTIPSWEFEQPVHMNFRGFKGTVKMPGIYRFGPGCRFTEPFTLARGTINSMTLGTDGHVLIDQYQVDHK